jgi:hypothetical protein
VSSTLFRLAADGVVLAHVAFVFFVLLGGLLVVRWPRLAWLHAPAALWGVLVEYSDSLCPLTPVENYLRERAGAAAYQGDFIEHHLMPLLYPARLTRAMQIVLGSAALLFNVLVYWRLVRKRRRA